MLTGRTPWRAFGFARAGAAALLCFTSVTACAKPEPRNYGEALQRAGKEIKLMGDEWQQGDAIEAEGRSMAAQGRAQMETARMIQQQGERTAAEGERRMLQGAAIKRSAEEKARRRAVNGTSYVGH